MQIRGLLEQMASHWEVVDIGAEEARMVRLTFALWIHIDRAPQLVLRVYVVIYQHFHGSGFRLP